MCQQPVSRIEFDVLDNVVRAMIASPDDTYWARRLIDLVRDPVTASRLRPHLVIAVQRWVAHDPSYFVHERYLSEQLAIWAWPRELLEDLDDKLRLEDPSLTHLIMGRFWLAARRPSCEMPDFYARAARHLRLVTDPLRVGAWHEAMCEALSVADPNELAKTANDILDTAPPSARDRALLAILRGAARAADWALYDQHRRHYGLFGEDPSESLSSEILRLDGLRAEHMLIHGRSGTRFNDGGTRYNDDDASKNAPTHRPSSTRQSKPPSTLPSIVPGLAELFEATTLRPRRSVAR